MGTLQYFSLVKVNRREHKRTEHVVLIHHELCWLIAINVIDGNTGPPPSITLLQGGPWTERLLVELVEVVSELCASVVQVSVFEVSIRH
jgi:hypothetical protein